MGLIGRMLRRRDEAPIIGRTLGPKWLGCCTAGCGLSVREDDEHKPYGGGVAHVECIEYKKGRVSRGIRREDRR